MKKYKYPRTYHLPYSETISSDDKRLSSDECFQCKQIIITEKMDGENITVYPNGQFHARSLDSDHKSYHSWLAADIQNWCYYLKPNQRVCGEYLFAKHSIEYNDLRSYFLAFSIWEDDTCLGISETAAVCEYLKIHFVPFIAEIKYNKDQVIQLAKKVIQKGGEGVVIRNRYSFKYNDFDANVAKYVRPNHVQTDEHWTKQQIIQNKLAKYTDEIKLTPYIMM